MSRRFITRGKCNVHAYVDATIYCPPLRELRYLIKTVDFHAISNSKPFVLLKKLIHL